MRPIPASSVVSGCPALDDDPRQPRRPAADCNWTYGLIGLSLTSTDTGDDRRTVTTAPAPGSRRQRSPPSRRRCRPRRRRCRRRSRPSCRPSARRGSRRRPLRRRSCGALSPAGDSPSRMIVSVRIGSCAPSARTSVWKRTPRRARSFTLPPRSTTVTAPSARCRPESPSVHRRRRRASPALRRGPRSGRSRSTPASRSAAR